MPLNNTNQPANSFEEFKKIDSDCSKLADEAHARLDKFQNGLAAGFLASSALSATGIPLVSELAGGVASGTFISLGLFNATRDRGTYQRCVNKALALGPKR